MQEISASGASAGVITRREERLDLRARRDYTINFLSLAETELQTPMINTKVIRVKFYDRESVAVRRLAIVSNSLRENVS